LTQARLPGYRLSWANGQIRDRHCRIDDGFDELVKAADHVIGEQLQRLKKLMDSESAPRGH